MTTGVALVTFNRPSFCEKSVKSVRKHLSSVIDHFVVVNDCSNSKYKGEYKRVANAVHSMNGTYMAMDVNRGPASAKNVGLQFLLEKHCDWLFTLEDDILIQSPKAVTEYLKVAKESGLSHFSFAHHGPANLGGAVEIDGNVEYYFHSIGAWCLFHRDDLLKHGLLDENFVRAWEHCEHELRLGCEPHRYPDIAQSADYLKEIPGSIEKSSIRPLNDWESNIRTGLAYWRDNRPDTFKSLFGDGTPLENFRRQWIG